MFYAVPVAPLAGAWIEIEKSGKYEARKRSLPSRERGLKWSLSHFATQTFVIVAPLAGAWIEIS